MNLGDLQTRTLATPIDPSSSAHGLDTASVNTQLQASGNRLLGLDVWAGSSAAERSLQAHAGTDLPPTTSIDQLAAHVLAPLGR
ncbi:hypothetical protein [Dyella sp.]|uniref:hypothetical protein n=1 Tax=Dyella sp. TaxID=1869338 RepID=UPI002ED6A69A